MSEVTTFICDQCGKSNPGQTRCGSPESPIGWFSVCETKSVETKSSIADSEREVSPLFCSWECLTRYSRGKSLTIPSLNLA